jgi:hypothetical protein
MLINIRLKIRHEFKDQDKILCIHVSEKGHPSDKEGNQRTPRLYRSSLLILRLCCLGHDSPDKILKTLFRTFVVRRVILLQGFDELLMVWRENIALAWLEEYD